MQINLTEYNLKRKSSYKQRQREDHFSVGLSRIDHLLKFRGWLRARTLLGAIWSRALEDAEYRKVVEQWLKTGSTSKLRDEIAVPVRGQINCPDNMDFFNRWDAIDTCWISGNRPSTTDT